MACERDCQQFVCPSGHFFTAEASDLLPEHAIRECDVVMRQTPRGLRANVSRGLGALGARGLLTSDCMASVWRGRGGFGLSLFHALCVQRSQTLGGWHGCVGNGSGVGLADLLFAGSVAREAF